MFTVKITAVQKKIHFYNIQISNSLIFSMQFGVFGFELVDQLGDVRWRFLAVC